MSGQPIPILATPVELFEKPADGSFAVPPAFAAEVGIDLVPGAAPDDSWQIRFRVLEQGQPATEKTKTYLIDYDPDHFTGELVDGEVYVFTLRALGGLADLLGLDFTVGGAATLIEVRVEVRPRAGDESWTKAAPFAAILFCWDLTTETAEEISLPGGNSIGGQVGVTVRACAGLAAIVPPSQGEGISNYAIRLDVESVGVSTGWMLLTPIEMPTIPDFDLPALSEFHMPALLKWLAALVPEFSMPSIKIDPIDWDMDFPLRLDLPLDLDFQGASLRVRDLDGGWRITTELKGLRAKIELIEVVRPDFAAELTWDGSKYLFRAVIADLHYPECNDQTGRYAFNLPFSLLGVSAACWRLRLGLFATDSSGKWRFCIDMILEVGELSVTSSVLDNPIYQANARVHLRGASLLTGSPPADLKLFDGIDASLTAFKPFRCVEVPALSFAGQEKQAAASKNEYGIAFLDGSYKAGERLHLAWQQRGGQLLKALSADLLGTEPAGVIPDGAAELWMALEVAWFPGAGGETKDTQVRLDWSNETPVDANGMAAPPGHIIRDEICVNPVDNALFVPERSGPPPALKDITTGDKAFALALPGASVSLHRPSSHSLVFRREADGRESFAWLGNYSPSTPLGFGVGMALARSLRRRKFSWDSAPRDAVFHG